MLHRYMTSLLWICTDIRRRSDGRWIRLPLRTVSDGRASRADRCMCLSASLPGVRPSHSRSSLLRGWMTHSCHPGQELGMEASTSSPQEREQRFRDIYEAGYVDLLRFLLRRVHPTPAEDVVGDVMLVAWRRLDDVPSDLSAARAWLFGVARKTLQNSRRREDRHDALAVRLAEVRHG